MVYDDPPAESPEATSNAPTTVPETKTRLEELKERLKEIKEKKQENRKEFREDLRVSRKEGTIGRVVRGEIKREGRRGRFFYKETANQNEKNARVDGKESIKWLKRYGREELDMTQIENRTGKKLISEQAAIDRKEYRSYKGFARVATRYDENGFRLSRRERRKRLQQALAEFNSASPSVVPNYAQPNHAPLAYPSFPDSNSSFNQFNQPPDKNKPSSSSVAFPWETVPEKEASPSSASSEAVNTNLERISEEVSKALENANMGELDLAARLILGHKTPDIELRKNPQPDSKMMVIRQMQAKLSKNEVASIDVKHLNEELKKSPDKQEEHANRMRAVSNKILELKDNLTVERIKELVMILDPTAEERGLFKDERMLETQYLLHFIDDIVKDPQFYTYQQGEDAEKYLNTLESAPKVAQKKVTESPAPDPKDTTLAEPVQPNSEPETPPQSTSGPVEAPPTPEAEVETAEPDTPPQPTETPEPAPAQETPTTPETTPEKPEPTAMDLLNALPPV